MKRLIKAFIYAVRGLIACCHREKNFQVQLIFGVVTIGMGVFFGISSAQWMIIAICIFTVLAFEMMNSAIEKLCDIINREYHPSIKLIKDISAGAVLVAALGSAVCGLCIFLPRILLFMQSTLKL